MAEASFSTTGWLIRASHTTTTELCTRSFQVAVPQIWNSLPPHLRSPTISQDQFWVGLKSHLFKCAYIWRYLRQLLRSELTYLLTYLKSWFRCIQVYPAMKQIQSVLQNLGSQSWPYYIILLIQQPLWKLYIEHLQQLAQISLSNGETKLLTSVMIGVTSILGPFWTNVAKPNKTYWTNKDTG